MYTWHRPPLSTCRAVVLALPCKSQGGCASSRHDHGFLNSSFGSAGTVSPAKMTKSYTTRQIRITHSRRKLNSKAWRRLWDWSRTLKASKKHEKWSFGGAGTILWPDGPGPRSNTTFPFQDLAPNLQLPDFRHLVAFSMAG